ncbi:MAG: glycosyltransferase [Planctomycetaceae bacterium]|jgi:glycosyltransferase involved in cell wall biosynthesis|nr:glycosyltransferase [Planctomycetaceae bacterium]
MFPKISIIIPVYNAEPYLRECLDSVINQTMREIQIICVNDGSTDGSPAILEEYAAKDTRILVVNKENGGVASARNTAFSYVTGKYLLFVDSDDTVDLRLCEKVYTKAEQSNADFVLFFHDTPNGHEFICDMSISPNDKVAWEEKKTILNFGTVWGKLWKTDFLKKYNLKSYEKIHGMEDALFFWEGLVLAEKISVVPESLYHYYIQGNSVASYYGKRSYEILDLWAEFKSFLQKGKYCLSLKTDFLENELNTIFHWYKRTEIKFQPDFIKKTKIFIGNDEIQFLRKGRHISPEALYFYYKLTGDRYILFKSIKKYIQQFPERYIIRPIVRFIKKTIRKWTSKNVASR